MVTCTQLETHIYDNVPEVDNMCKSQVFCKTFFEIT